MFSMILRVLSCTLIMPPNLLFASSSFVAETSTEPPVVEVTYASSEDRFFALISAPVDTELSWYSADPKTLIFAPVVAVVLSVLRNTKMFWVDPVFALMLRSACFIVSLEKTLDPSWEIILYKVL